MVYAVVHKFVVEGCSDVRAFLDYLDAVEQTEAEARLDPLFLVIEFLEYDLPQEAVCLCQLDHVVHVTLPVCDGLEEGDVLVAHDAEVQPSVSFTCASALHGIGQSELAAYGPHGPRS